ncbi:MAG: hypothetical protein AAGH19_08000 [Pseudomonadota bacterium]
MIINCPNCGKPMSSKAAICPHCAFERGEASDEQLEEFARRRLRDRIYRLKMASYTAITLLLSAAGWYFYEASDLDLEPSAGPLLLVAVGSVAYVITRALLFKARRDLKRR